MNQTVCGPIQELLPRGDDENCPGCIEDLVWSAGGGVACRHNTEFQRLPPATTPVCVKLQLWNNIEIFIMNDRQRIGARNAAAQLPKPCAITDSTSLLNSTYPPQMAAPPSSRSRPSLLSRKRISAIRLSTDTTGSLPAYSSPPSSSRSEWPNSQLDDPPDYPQSAEDADHEDADHEDAGDADREDDRVNDHLVPLRGSRSAATRRLRHRRSESASLPTSPSVDDLLQRSVVALELSTNALLQSMNTQSSISAIANDRILERSLDRQTRMLDLRIRGSRDAHEGWMDDLDQVIKGVDGLFLDDPNPEAAVSRSLPTEDSHMRPRRRDRPSPLTKSVSDSPYLHLSTSELDLRDGVRPPRALTQYVSVESAAGEACEATADAESIYLPSTTGLRAAAQIRTFAGKGARAHPRLRQSASSPGLDSHYTPSTPAYNMLSQLAGKKSPSPRTGSPSASLHSPGASDTTSRRTTRRYSADSIDSSSLTHTLRRSRSTSRAGSSASTETPPAPPVRAMTPPLEEATPSSSSTSSLNAFRSVQSLRKILDDASPLPPPPDATTKRARFLPRSPAVAPSAGTSTATASVSRLFTRSSHHAPHVAVHARHSSLKKRPTPMSTPPVPSTPSTTPSTPRNVSFAELPDSYSGRARRRGRDKEKGKGKGGEKPKERRGLWWSGWFSDVGSGMGTGLGAARHEERIEERIMRGWGRGGGTEEWML